jgi:outer membrane protein
MMRIILFALLTTAVHSVFAQSNATQGDLQAIPVLKPVSLGDCLDLAVANSTQLKKARLDRQSLEQRLREGRSAAYPQINAGINFDYTPVLPTQLLPGELFGQGDNTFLPVQFGRPWQAGAYFQVEQTLYNESFRKGIPAINVTRSIYDLLLERSEDEVRFNTAQVFYQTIQTEQLLRAVNANHNKLVTLERMAELQLKNGYAIPTDVKRIKVARTNLETQRQNLLTAISALKQTLQFLCGISPEEPFDPVEDISNPTSDSLQWQSIKLETEAAVEYRLILRNLELNRLQSNSLLAEAVPTLNAYAAGMTQTLRDNANIFDPGSRWYGYATVGFRVKIPVFDGFRRRRKAGLFKIENQKLEEDRRQLVQAKALEFKLASEQVKNALNAVHTQTDNVVLATEITDKMTLQYKEGVAPLTDLLNAQTAQSEAESNYWQQVYTYKLAILKLLKAAGRMEMLQ